MISLTYNQVRTNGLFAEAREGEVRWTYFMGELTLRVGTLQLSLEPALERVRVPYASARSLHAFGPLPSSARGASKAVPASPVAKGCTPTTRRSHPPGQ